VDARRELGVTRLGPRVFRRQMETLAAAGVRTLGAAELEGALAAEDPAGLGAPARPLSPPDLLPLTSLTSVVLTFDDGYEPLARHAFPVLADLGLRALVFVVTDYVGRDNDWDVHYGWRRFRHLSWDDLAHWQERGIEVHSHGATHARLTWVSDEQAEDELGRSREAIARRLGGGAPPAGIAYPFGAVDARVRALAAAAGYSLGFAGPAGSGGRQPAGADRLALRRRPVYPWDASAIPWVLREDVAGALAMAAARFTSRCAVGTALFQRLLGARYTASR
jgi:peptidoglycan/xylan/chitin deacetylase (PgdA/CDA1 family)